MNISDEELKRFLEGFMDEEVLELINVVNTEHEIDYTKWGDETSPIDVESSIAYGKILKRITKYTARYLASIEDEYKLEDDDFERLHARLLKYVKAFIIWKRSEK